LGSCSVRFTPSTSGTTTVTANYSGDENHIPGSAISVMVSKPAPITGSLTVTVYGPNGDSIMGATVSLVAGPSGQTLPSSMLTAANGTVTFTGLSPGAYSYTVTASGYQPRQTITATVASGQTASSQATLSEQNIPPANIFGLYPTVFYGSLAGIVALIAVS